MSNAFLGVSHYVPYSINATDLAAGTTQYAIAPCDGHIARHDAVVQVTIGTGGTLKAHTGSNDVAGSTLTVANSAVAGTAYSVNTTAGDPTCNVKKGDVISIVVDAAFATAGAVNGTLEVRGGKNMSTY